MHICTCTCTCGCTCACACACIGCVDLTFSLSLLSRKPSCLAVEVKASFVQGVGAVCLEPSKLSLCINNLHGPSDQRRSRRARSRIFANGCANGGANGRTSGGTCGGTTSHGSVSWPPARCSGGVRLGSLALTLPAHRPRPHATL